METEEVNGKGQIRPITIPKPLTRSSPKLACVLVPWMSPGTQSFVAINATVSASQIRDFDVLRGDHILFVFWGCVFIRCNPNPWTVTWHIEWLQSRNSEITEFSGVMSFPDRSIAHQYAALPSPSGVVCRCWSRTRPETRGGRWSWESERSRMVDEKSGVGQRPSNGLWA